jgi:hypothetical protein
VYANSLATLLIIQNRVRCGFARFESRGCTLCKPAVRASISFLTRTEVREFLLSLLGRAFVSRLNCVLLGHVFAFRRCAVKRRALPVVNACLCINPYQARTTARRLRACRFFGCAPCGHWACTRTRFRLRFRFLGSGFCFRRSRWRLGG